jgi:hypothetical protein
MKSKIVLALHINNVGYDSDMFLFEDKQSLRTHLQNWLKDKPIKMMNEDEELVQVTLDKFLKDAGKIAEVTLGFPHQYPYEFSYTYEQLYSL